MSPEEFFGEPISVHTRTQALEDGSLIDATERAREVGFRWPMAITAAAWAEAVTVPYNLRGLQNESGRLHDLLTMAYFAVRWRKGGTFGSEIPFEVSVMRTRGTPEGYAHERVALRLLAHPGDGGEPVLTIMLPGED